MQTIFKGKIKSSGATEEIQFEKGFLLASPEFFLQQEVIAYIISPGHLLISAQGADCLSQEPQDPVVASFLNYLVQDMERIPQHILPLTQEPINRVTQLVQDVQASDEDIIPDNITL